MTIAYVQTAGDPSVGIDGCYTEVDLNYPVEELGREECRARLAECFSTLWGERAVVQFEDEFSTKEPVAHPRL